MRVCVFWPENAIFVLLRNYITFLLLNISEGPLSAALIFSGVISKSQILLTGRLSPSGNWVFLRQQRTFSGKLTVQGFLSAGTQVRGFISLCSWLMDKQVWNGKNAFQ